MVTALVKAYSGDVEKLIEEAKKAKQGRKGLKVGCNAHVLDAAILVKKCWDTLAPSVIQNCWSHSKCLPSVDNDGNLFLEDSSCSKEAHENSVNDFQKVGIQYYFEYLEAP